MAEEATKKKRKKPNRRVAEVAIPHDYLHYLPFSLNRKRVTGYADVKTFDWGKIVISAAETINLYDFTVLLAIMRFIQNNPHMVEHKNLAGKPVVEIYMPRNELYKSVGNAHPEAFFGHTDKRGVWHHGHITRLATWSFTIVSNVDRENPVLMSPLKDYNIQQDKYVLSKYFMEDCLKGFNIDLPLFVSLSDQNAQALYLYCRVNNCNQRGIDMFRVATAMGLPYETPEEQRTARSLIKTATTKLEKKGVLVSPEIKRIGKGFYKLGWFRGDHFYGEKHVSQ